MVRFQCFAILSLTTWSRNQTIETLTSFQSTKKRKPTSPHKTIKMEVQNKGRNLTNKCSRTQPHSCLCVSVASSQCGYVVLHFLPVLSADNISDIAETVAHSSARGDTLRKHTLDVHIGGVASVKVKQGWQPAERPPVTASEIISLIG